MAEISIVLPVYNGEDRVGKAIESILNQTYTDFELIIVNDCSTDNTAAIVENYAKTDNRIRVFSNSYNLKLPKSLNSGFRQATGKYYTWTSDDNYYANDAIEIMIGYLKQHSDVDMVYCDMRIVGENDNLISKNLLDEPQKLTQYNCVGACFMYTSQIASKVGEYNESFFLAEDYDYWLRVYEIGKIIHLNELVYFYKRHSRSLTSTKMEDIKNVTLDVWIKHLDFIINSIQNEDELYKFFEGMVSYAGEKRRRDVLKIIFDKKKDYRWEFMKKNPVTYIKFLLKN